MVMAKGLSDPSFARRASRGSFGLTQNSSHSSSTRRSQSLSSNLLLTAWIILSGCVTILDGKVYIHQAMYENQRGMDGRGNSLPLPALGRDEAGHLGRTRRSADTDKGGGGGGDGAGKNPGGEKAAGGGVFVQLEDGDKLDVSVTKLNDTKHNEAIVHWSGQKNNVVFVLTREHYSNGTVPDSTLYRSKDYGSNFYKLTSVPRGAVIRYYYSCPSNKSKLVFTDVKAQKLYITHDEGDNLEPLKVPFPPEHLVFHPRRQDWILGYSFKDRKLYMTPDLGKHWDEVAQYVNFRFYWAVPGVDSIESTIHMEIQDPTTGEYHYKACAMPYMDCRNETTVNPDFGAIDIDSLIVQNEYIFVQRSTQFSSSLYVSYNRGALKKAFFPFTVHPQDFSILNTAQHQVFIAADHRDKTVNLYLSDVTGQFFIKSLEHVVALRRQNGGFDTDLYEVRGVNGTYIVNQHTDGNPRSLISFDQGGKWQSMRAPLADGTDNGHHPCKPLTDCGLHIHLGFSRTVYGIPYILSEDNAPGLILAQGTLGSELSTRNSTLFISSDAGYTWRALFKGNYNYNILDQGGAIVAVADSSSDKTNSIFYSCTEGQTWTKHTFLSDKVQVDGVLNEPGITTLIASVYGHLDRDSGWVIVKVDFHSILKRKCVEEDYEIWDPTSDLKGSYCILGQRHQYKHRKQQAACFNGEEYENAINVSICDCVRDDYECDFGYELMKDGRCEKSSWYDLDEPLTHCPENTFYNKTRGYRLIAADKCRVNAGTMQDIGPVRTLCPLMRPEGLRLSTSTHRITAPTGTKVTFKLTQDKGSDKSTEYIWTFGDRVGESVRVKGLTGAHIQNHTYVQQGVYTVTVTAKNQKGTATTSKVIRIEDALRGVYISTPHGAQVHRPVKFEAVPVTANLSQTTFNNVHFLWLFGDEPPGQHPYLTYKHEVLHTYKKRGNYTVTLEVVNSVSSIFERFIVSVYNTLKTVQMVFGEDVDRLNKHTAMWRKLFADLLKRTLVRELEVSPSRLEVVVLPGRPVKTDVSVLPPLSSTEGPIDLIVSRLISRIHSGSLSIELSDSDFGSGTVQVADAYVISEKPQSVTQNNPSRIALVVCVPLVLVAVFFIGLFIMYQRRRCTGRGGGSRRYSVLQSQSVAAAADDLLGASGDGEDDEDDDPPLDPDPDHHAATLSTRGGSRQRNGLHTFGRREQPLVMTVTQTQVSDSLHAENTPVSC